MPRSRPAASGYARIAQAEEEEEEEEGYLDDSDDERHRTISERPNNSQYAPIQPGRRAQMGPTPSASETVKWRRKHGRRRTNSGVDIKAINARLEKWADEIAQKFKIKKFKGKSFDEEKLEIHYSVFQAPEGLRPATAETLHAEQPEGRLSKVQFDDIVESIRVAIELGMHPKMISQGSSGSYFARNSDGKTVGVFKPKDEEPYASRNPKWTKWIHRNLFPFFFGRACLIPNLSYVSEAAAYILDTRLQTNIVPYTDIVHFSSIAFNYDLWDRRAYYRKRKQLPQKVGSLQVFLNGFKDANLFLKAHPWPDQPTSAGQRRSRSRGWTDDCRPGGARTEDEDNELPSRGEAQQRREFWTDALQQSFREQLEKLVILDYIMRNTDRGLDNWMIRIDEEKQEAAIVAEAPKLPNDEDGNSYPREGPMNMNGDAAPDGAPKFTVGLGAIDNSLSWPWKHPDAWRSFPFGWLFLPVSLIGQPFSENTRNHFLPLLTSKQWWSETQLALRRCFSQDADFQERMYARQIAVMKGQAWNVVETLKTPDHGPLELTRRARVHVWDDLVDIPTVTPMHAASRASLDSHPQRGPTASTAQREEMDISALRSHTPQLERTLLDLGQQPNGLPNPNKFHLSRETSDDATHVNDAEGHSRRSADVADGVIAGESSQRRPATQRSWTRASHEESRQKPGHKTRKRNMSFGARNVSDYEDDDGDLGYSAARDMEGNRKKVIVERLETVKGKNPFFTWC